MGKSKNQWINMLRWISIIPIVIFVYLTFKFIYSYVANYLVSEILSLMLSNFSDNKNNEYNYIYEINKVQGFSGHYLIGSIYILTRELLGIALAIFSGIYIAPSHKRLVGYLLMILLLISSIVTNQCAS